MAAIIAVRQQQFESLGLQDEEQSAIKSLRDCTLEMLLATGADQPFPPPLWFRRVSTPPLPPAQLDFRETSDSLLVHKGEACAEREQAHTRGRAGP